MVLRLVVAVFLIVCAPVSAHASVQAPLRLHAWVGYFPAWLLDGFTAETGISVVQSFFADNKALYRSITEEGSLRRFDVITPSAEMVQQLASEGLLVPLDRKSMPNAAGVDTWFQELGYDLGGKYSVPLFWGVVGMVIDKKVLPESVALRIKGYKDLWLPELKGLILLPNDFRSLMSIMLLYLGYSVNDRTPEHLEDAMAALESLAPSVRTFDTVDQDESMAKRNTGVGVVWAKEQYACDDVKKRYQFIFPAEGSPAWIDTLAVPVTSASPETAFRFINYVMRTDVLARLGEETGYALTVPAAQALLPKPLRDNTVVYPPLELRRSFEPELMLPAFTESLEKRWNKRKIAF